MPLKEFYNPSVVHPEPGYCLDARRAACNLASGWSELWRKEDWWAVWIDLGMVLIASCFYANGSSIGWLAVSPGKWSMWKLI